MPTLLSHPAVPLAIGLALGARIIPRRLLAVGVAASVLPDIDVLAFSFGIPYAHPFGHRGFTHSVFFALLVAALGAVSHRRWQSSAPAAFWFLLVATASHGLLDAMTTGGLGIGFFQPLDNARYFLPWRLIDVSPIGIANFLNGPMWRILYAEWLWVWLPSLFVYALLRLWRLQYREDRR